MKTAATSIVLLTVAACLGCGSPAPERPAIPAAKPEHTIRVTPTDFFSGDLKRLGPHLAFISAVCFKVKPGGEVRCRPEMELWREGKRIDIPKYGFRTDPTSDEISFTVRRLPPENGDSTRYMAVVGGMEQFGRVFDKPRFQPPLEVAFGPVSLEKPLDITLQSGSAIVWAMGGGDGLNPSDPQDKLQGQLEALPWAMILRLRVEWKKDG
jgi:hypothetical protein